MLPVGPGEGWVCSQCTFINCDINFDGCFVCGSDNVKLREDEDLADSRGRSWNIVSTSQDSTSRLTCKGFIVCTVCTYRNSGDREECDMCTVPLGHDRTEADASYDSAAAVGGTGIDEGDESDSDPLDAYYAVASEHFDDLVKLDATSSQYRCLIDGKQCSKKAIMVAYLVKNHHEQLDRIIRAADGLGGDAAAADTSTPLTTLPSDREVALQMLLDEYDQMIAVGSIDASTSTGLLSSPRMRDSLLGRIHPTPTLRGVRRSRDESLMTPAAPYKDGNDDLAMASVISLDDMKMLRLTKLMRKTDKLVREIKRLMDRMKRSLPHDNHPSVIGSSVDQTHGIGGVSVDVACIYSLLSPGCELRDYQLGGVRWLYSLYRSGLNGILADEMGLGKTLQIISFLVLLCAMHELRGPHLIVMPLSVISSWTADFAKFGGDSFEVHIHHGDRDTRLQLFEVWYNECKSNFRHHRKTCRWISNKIQVCVTTYEVLIRDEAMLSRLRSGLVRWEYLIVDEAQRLKNKQCRLFRSLRRIHAMRPDPGQWSMRPSRLDSDSDSFGKCILLSGTPLQNNVNELWALFSFILPTIFEEHDEFTDWFNKTFESDDDDDGSGGVGVGDDGDVGQEEHCTRGDETGRSDDRSQDLSGCNAKMTTVRKKRKCRKLFRVKRSGAEDLSSLLSSDELRSIVASLHRVIKPFLLRRVKADVMKDLPPKIERVVYCQLSALQLKVHELLKLAVEEYDRDRLGSSDGYGRSTLCDLCFGGKSLLTINNLLMQLRKLCNHPFLVLEDIRPIPDALYFDDLVTSSGKLFVLDKVLSNLLESGSKVLVFSQMTSMLDIIEGYLQLKGVTYCRLDGNTSHEDRQQQIGAFTGVTAATARPIGSTEDSRLPSVAGTSVFLLSTRAGGVGLNLQAADTVILYDSDWNPQQDLQAISRAHRIGQTRPVLVLRLVSLGPDERSCSVDQHILRRASRKLQAERQVLADGLFDMGTALSQQVQVEGDRAVYEEQEDEDGIDYCHSDSLKDLFEITADTVEGESSVQRLRTASDPQIIRDICSRSATPPTGSSSIISCDNFSIDTRHRPGGEHELWMATQSIDETRWEAWLRPQATAQEETTSDSYISVGDDLNGTALSTRSTRKRIMSSALLYREDCPSDHSDEQHDGDDDEFVCRATNAAPLKRTKGCPSSADDDRMPLAEDDICALCGQAWVTPEAHSTYLDLKRAGDAGPLAVARQLQSKQKQRVDDIMVLCDGCNGSYHLICVGLDDVPSDDWYCRWCKDAR